jgi:hypothetical protein
VQAESDQVDARDRQRDVAAGGDAGVDERIEEVHERVAHGKRAKEYGGHGPVVRSS